MCIFLHIFLYLCVCVGYVGREISGIIISFKCLSRSVSPCAVESIICSNKLKCGTGFKCCQAGALVKHISHIRHLRCIKRCQIQTSQAGATLEHSSHSRHIRCIKRCQIQTSQAGALVKHISHIRHIRCIKWCQIQAR